MLQKPALYKLHKSKAELRWNKLKLQVQEILATEIKAIHQLTNFDFQGMKYQEFERILQSYFRVLNGFKIMKRGCRLDLASLSEDFIEKERKDSLERIISDIGKKYEQKIEWIIKAWR